MSQTDRAEYFDIYDENKLATGRTMARRGSFLARGEYQLVVLALIERPDHHFLITRRSLDKKWAAGCWETSGGGAQAGETSLQAVIREVREETGLDISSAEGSCVYTYSNTDLERGDNYFVDIYHFCLDFREDQVRLQKDEAIDFQIVPFSVIEDLGKGGTFLHYQRILEALSAEGYIPFLPERRSEHASHESGHKN